MYFTKTAVLKSSAAVHFQFPRFEIGLGRRVWSFRGYKLLNLLAKFADGFTVIKMPLMPRCIILWRTTHHHDEPLSVKITEVINKNIETFSSKLAVWNHCHD